MATAAFLRPEEEKLFEGQTKVDLSMLIDFRKLAVLKLGLPFDSPVAQFRSQISPVTSLFFRRAFLLATSTSKMSCSRKTTIWESPATMTKIWRKRS